MQVQLLGAGIECALSFGLFAVCRRPVHFQLKPTYLYAFVITRDCLPFSVHFDCSRDPNNVNLLYIGEFRTLIL